MKLSTSPGALPPVRILCTNVVAIRYAIEEAAPQNPMIPAQINVTWSSVGRVHSSNQIQNLRRRSVCRFRPVARVPVSVTSTLIHCVFQTRRQVVDIFFNNRLANFWKTLALVRTLTHMIVIVFGVSGAGKTTIGKLLAQQLGWHFLEADDFHPAANIDKMRSGHPLTDEDRWPWLERLRQQIERSLATGENAVVACSALKRAYRDVLRVADEVTFVFLRGDYPLIEKQLRSRHRHFMNSDLLQSQFGDLEEPQPGEHALIVTLGRTPEEIVQQIKTKLHLASKI